jgi:hypothetical protein
MAMASAVKAVDDLMSLDRGHGDPPARVESAAIDTRHVAVGGVTCDLSASRGV